MCYLVLLHQPPSVRHSASDNGHALKSPEALLPRPQTRLTPSAAIKVGDMVLLEKNQRVPADMVLLTTSEEEGTCFIRTDQLDGETDWKLKVAVGDTQKMGDAGIGAVEGNLYGETNLYRFREAELNLSVKPIHRSRISIHSMASSPFSPYHLAHRPRTPSRFLSRMFSGPIRCSRLALRWD